MQLELTSEQVLLGDSVRSVLEAEYGQAGRQASIAQRDGCRPALWRRFADLGWLLLPAPEDAGGLGGSLVDLGIVLQALGRHLVVEPYLAGAVIGCRLLAGVGGAEAGGWLERALAGEVRVVLAHGELGDVDPFVAPRCAAVPSVGARGSEDGDWLLTGFKPLVAGAPGAGLLLVSACDPQGRTGLFAVAADAPGLQLHHCQLADGSHAGDVRLQRAQTRRLGSGADDHLLLLQHVLAQAVVLQCWEAQGAMRAALDATAAYTATRQQFGHPLAQFQVVQHRLAEMLVACEDALAACQLAALRIDNQPASLDVALDAAALAKSRVGRSARLVAQEAVQLHGAMGVCEELPIAATFRKLTGFGQQLLAVATASALLGRRQLASNRWRHSQTLMDAAA